MSRIGRMPIDVLEGISVKVKNGVVEVEGVKGKLSRKLPGEIKLELKEDKLWLSRASDERRVRGLHGLWRSLVANMVEGVSRGYGRKLKLVGTGYRAKMEGEKLIITCGFSHPAEVKPVVGVKLETPDNETIQVSGVDKELVGQMAARIRAIRPPEPYKGKGIRYEGEEVRRKAGKAGKVGGAGEKGAE
ncbi:MAG: 50S ribosomal protein L6 [Candidatus Shapirobacteria bacterium]